MQCNENAQNAMRKGKGKQHYGQREDHMQSHRGNSYITPINHGEGT